MRVRLVSLLKRQSYLGEVTRRALPQMQQALRVLQQMLRVLQQQSAASQRTRPFSCPYPALQQARTASRASCHLRRRQHAAERRVTGHIHTDICSTPDSTSAQHAAQRHVTCQSLFEAQARTCGLRRTRLRCNGPSDAPAMTQRLRILLARYWLYY